METVLVQMHIKKKQLLWIMTEFANKCDKFALRILCFNATLVIILIAYFSLLRLYNIADENEPFSFSNTFINFSIKLFFYTLLFFIIFVLFIILVERLVYKIPRILIWSSLILPQTIIFTTKMQFPCNDEIPLTHSQHSRILTVLSNLKLYMPHFHHLICLNHYQNANINISNTAMLAYSLHAIMHEKYNNLTIWNCDNLTAINRLQSSYQRHGFLSFTWWKLLLCIIMYLAQNYLFHCACIWSSSVMLTILLIIMSMYAHSDNISDNYPFCKLVNKFQDKAMQPIDRYLKVHQIIDSVLDNNYHAVTCLNSMEEYLRCKPHIVPQNQLYLSRFSKNLNLWCAADVDFALDKLNGKQYGTGTKESALIDGVYEIETRQSIKNRKMMYAAGGDMYKILLMIVALLWAYLCDVWIGISRIVYTQWRKRLLLFHYMPVDDVCDLIMQYQCTSS